MTEENIIKNRLNLMNPASLESATNTMTRCVSAHRSIADAIVTKIERARNLAEDNLNRLADSEETRKALQPQMLKQFQLERDKLVSEYEAERLKPLKELGELDAAAAEAITHYEPLTLATMHGLGTEERQRMASDVNGYGVAVLVKLHDRAIATGDKMLAAALIAEQDKRPKADRAPWSSAALAQKVFGADSEKHTATLRAIRKAYAESVAAERNLKGKPLTGVEKIKMQLDHGNSFKNPMGLKVTQQTRSMSALDKIGAALARGEI